MIPLFGRHDLVLPGGGHREFERRLDRLCPRIAEERARQTGRRDLLHRRQCRRPHVVVKTLVTGSESRQLVGQCRRVFRVGVPEHRNPIIAHRIEVTLAVRIEQITTFAPYQRDIALCIERRLVVLLKRLNDIERQCRRGRSRHLKFSPGF